MLPGASEAAIQSIEQSAGMFMDISGTMREYHLKGAVQQLLLHLEPEILSHCVPAYRCDCSRERVERALISLGREELEDMIREQHGAQVDCHFCNKRYQLSEAQLRDLLERATHESEERMSFDPKVVPFDRSAAYMHHRAMKNRRDNNVVDALELLRRAVERSPDNDEYKLDHGRAVERDGLPFAVQPPAAGHALRRESAQRVLLWAGAEPAFRRATFPGRGRRLSRYRGADPRGPTPRTRAASTTNCSFTRCSPAPRAARAAAPPRWTDLGCERMREEEFRRAARLFERSL